MKVWALGLLGRYNFRKLGAGSILLQIAAHMGNGLICFVSIL